MISNLQLFSKMWVYCVFLIILISCGGGGGSVDDGNAGYLKIGNNNKITDVVTNGSHQYTVSINNAHNLKHPIITINVTNSNNNVAVIESNTCNNPIYYQDGYPDWVNSCGFYVRALSTGSTIITIQSDKYASKVIPLQIVNDWGTFGGIIFAGSFSETFVRDLYFSESKVYAYLLSSGVAVSTGNDWQEVGGGPAIPFTYNGWLNGSGTVALNESHICVAFFESNNMSGFSGDSGVRCSTNDATWQSLPDIIGWNENKIQLRGNILYMLANQSVNGYGYIQALFSCPVNGCSAWQKIIDLPNYEFGTSVFFESSLFVQNSTSFYQYSGESVVTIAPYPFNNNDFTTMSAGDNGIALTHKQSSVGLAKLYEIIYYNNIGSNNFESIATILDHPNNYVINITAPYLAMNDGILYASLGDGYIYANQQYADKTWSGFTLIGGGDITPNLLLYKIYVHDNKLYSISYLPEGEGSQVYVYTLSNQPNQNTLTKYMDK